VGDECLFDSLVGVGLFLCEGLNLRWDVCERRMVGVSEVVLFVSPLDFCNVKCRDIRCRTIERDLSGRVYRMAYIVSYCVIDFDEYNDSRV
jgi:hypothetical protein